MQGETATGLGGTTAVGGEGGEEAFDRADSDISSTYRVIHSHVQVSQAAAEFLNEKLFKYKGDEEPPEVRTKHGKRRSMNTPFVRDLIQFFIESELHEHAAYLVDSMWDVNEMMKVGRWEMVVVAVVTVEGH